MQVLDFHRSFLYFEIDWTKKPPRTVTDPNQNQHNRARIRIDCHLRLTTPGGQTTDYYLGEACKTERVGADRATGIFNQPNADFRPVLSASQALIFKSWDKNDKGVMLVPPSLGPQPERQIISTDEAFYRSGFILAHTDTDRLPNAAAVAVAADRGAPVVAHTELDLAGYHVAIQYPVLTLNVSEQYDAYQTDTGPVLYPDLETPHSDPLETFRLAFCAFNSPDWTEFIVQRPTPIAPGISVNHYSHIVTHTARNQLLATP